MYELSEKKLQILSSGKIKVFILLIEIQVIEK